MRRRVWQFWDAHGWMLVGLAASLAFVAGLVGWSTVASTSPGELSWTTRLYLTLQLFTLDSGVVEAPTPPALEVARFLAPLSLATAALGTVVAIVARNNATLRARFVDGHLVVVGLGDRGLLIAQRARTAGDDVVVVEEDPADPHVPTARRAGIPVVLGDGTDRETLAAAGVHRARRLISVAGDPVVNAGVAQSVLAFQAVVEFRPGFESFIELADVPAMRELEAFVEHERLHRRQEFFNLADRAGAAIVDRHQLFEQVPADTEPRPVVVVGTSPTAVSVLVGAARRWTLSQWGSEPRRVLHLWMLADDPSAADDAATRVRQLHPEVAIESAATDPDTTREPPEVVLHLRILPRFAVDEALADLLARAWPSGPSLVVLAQAGEAAQLRMATAAWGVFAGHDVPLVVTAPRRQSLVSLLDQPAVSGGPARPGIEVFAINEELCSDEQIQQGRVDTIARALHAGYRRHLERVVATDQRPAGDADRPWRDLSPEYRRMNVDAANALWGMLARHGFVAVPRGGTRPGVAEFPRGVVKSMAREEHLRWFRAKFPGARPPDWSDVEERHKVQTRDQVARIPASLRVAGLAIVADAGVLADSSSERHIASTIAEGS